MALNTRQKDRIRHAIRGLMIGIAVLLLLFSVGIPIVNNAIGLHVESELKSLPLPERTEAVESTSVVGKLVGNGNGMQYFGALLLKSELTLEELSDHYRPYRQGLYDCLVEYQVGNEVRPYGTAFNASFGCSFRSVTEDSRYYILYTWEDTPDWAQDLLNTDPRGH